MVSLVVVTLTKIGLTLAKPEEHTRLVGGGWCGQSILGSENSWMLEMLPCLFTLGLGDWTVSPMPAVFTVCLLRYKQFWLERTTESPCRVTGVSW